LELAQKAPLDPPSGHVFRQLTHGASINVERYSDEISRALQSESAIEMARAFLLSQVLVEGLTPERRAQVLEGARRSLDEIGVLSIDAIVTLSVLSASREDAYMLLHLTPSIGVHEQLHRVTCVKGVARILRNAGDVKIAHPIFSS
jgi:hypothetical protein